MLSGIARIDDRYKGVAGAQLFTEVQPVRQAVGAIQDLIRGVGKRRVRAALRCSP